MKEGIPLTGELAALSGAFCWALSAMLYGRVGATVSPLLLNVFKGTLALLLLGMTSLWLGLDVGRLEGDSTRLLLLSGALGIGIGDTAYFQALKRLGARQTLLLETLSSPLVAAIAVLLLEEQLQLVSWLGIALTLSGVAWVIGERSPQVLLEPQQFQQGLLWGLLAQLTQASGAVLSRAALAESSISPISSSLLRLAAGLAIAQLWLLGQPSQRLTPASLWTPRTLGFMALAAFLGTYGAMILQQTAFKYARAGVAQTLLATSPLFVLPLAALAGERISPRAILGTLLAIAGIFLLFR